MSLRLGFYSSDPHQTKTSLFQMAIRQPCSQLGVQPSPCTPPSGHASLYNNYPHTPTTEFKASKTNDLTGCLCIRKANSHALRLRISRLRGSPATSSRHSLRLPDNLFAAISSTSSSKTTSCPPVPTTIFHVRRITFS